VTKEGVMIGIHVSGQVGPGPVVRVGAALRRLRERVEERRRARSEREARARLLGSLSERPMRDLGMTPEDAVGGPIWREDLPWFLQPGGR
jgi:hypothetical protein